MQVHPAALPLDHAGGQPDFALELRVEESPHRAAPRARLAVLDREVGALVQREAALPTGHLDGGLVLVQLGVSMLTRCSRTVPNGAGRTVAQRAPARLHTSTELGESDQGLPKLAGSVGGRTHLLQIRSLGAAGKLASSCKPAQLRKASR